MFQLTVNQSNKSDIYRFEQQRVTIGAKGDLNISHLPLQDVHIEMEELGGKVVILNRANDPFAALDGEPFGKRTVLKKGVIELGGVLILVELVKQSLPSVSPVSTEEIVSQEEIDKLDVDKLLQEMEQMDEEEKAVHESPRFNQEKAVPKSENAPKVFNDLVQSPEKLNISTQWRWIIAVVFILIVSVSGFLGFLYLRASTKSTFFEHEIAAALSDVAMTLAYVKVNQINPPKQDWSHPLFLQQNLAKVLPHHHLSFAQLDSQGRFIEKPYLLRIYTEPELSRFLVIAQPSSTFFEKLSPRSAIAVDSKTMELKKVSDIKTLNRLLANPHPLKGSNGELISEVVQQGSTILLSSLAEAFHHEDFLPPKALGFLQPAAQQKIYNAPRYYRLSEAFINFVLSFGNSSPTAQDMVVLHQQLESLEEMPYLVLYVPNGLKEANDLQQLLAVFAPQKTLQIGYLSSIGLGSLSSHLLLQESPLTAIGSTPIDDKAVEKEQLLPEHHYTVPHPLVLQLRSLLNERQRALQPIGDEITYLFSTHTQTPLPDFPFQLAQLVQVYQEKDRELAQLVALRLGELYREDYLLTPDEFIGFVEQAGLKGALEKLPSQGPQYSQEIANSLMRIKEAESLAQLEEAIDQVLLQSSLQEITDLNVLISFQNGLRIAVMYSLKRMLLSPRHIQVEQLQIERAQLLHLLAAAHINNTEEVEYFLKEFDLVGRP